MSLILRSLIRDPHLARPMIRPFSRAIRRWDDDLWVDPWPTKRTRRALPSIDYESPAAHLMEDMSRSMMATMNRMQEQFAEDLETLDSLVGKLDNQGRAKGSLSRKRREEITVRRTESGGLQLALDVADFKPEDLKINVVDDSLVVEAVNESSGKDSYRRNQFKRWFKLPEDCKLEEIRSKLTEDNRLLIDLPSNKPLEQKARSIPIEMSKTTPGKDNVSGERQAASQQVNNEQEAAK